MIYQTHRGNTSNASAYRLVELINAIASTDDAELVAEFELAAQEAGHDLAEHLEQMLDVRRDLLAAASAIDTELERLQELKAIRLKRAARLHDAVAHYMTLTESKEIMTDLFTIRVKRNPPKVDIYDEALLPREYIKETTKVELKPDKAAIAEGIKAGFAIPGAVLIQTNRLEIK